MTNCVASVLVTSACVCAYGVGRQQEIHSPSGSEARTVAFECANIKRSVSDFVEARAAQQHAGASPENWEIGSQKVG